MEPFIGQIMMFAGNFAPRGWAFCEGQLLAINQNTALFSILGTTYGGDGRTTFGLPDLRGRAPIHPGTGPGLTSRRLGEKNGTENNTLTQMQLPSHTHSASGTLNANNAVGNTNNPSGNSLAISKTPIDRTNTVDTNTYTNAAANTPMANNVSVQVGNTGGNQAVNNMQPFLGLNYIIALQGVYPSRS